MSVRLLFALIFCFLSASGQVEVKISGVVVDGKNAPLRNVSVSALTQDNVVQTNELGEYIIYSKNTVFKLQYNLLGFEPRILEFNAVKGSRIVKNVQLIANVNELEQVAIMQKAMQLSNTIPIHIEQLKSVPLASGNFESIVKTLPGVSVNSELTAQYSVRGGNYEDNALYLNDVEIIRPIYVRNSQHEGLSFINPDLVSRARFSAGGYEARYADKMASVLDVKYEAPTENELSFSPGLLNSSVTYKKNFGQDFLLLGARYKNNGALLSKQDIKGRYNPNFADIQLLYQNNLSDKWQLSILGNLNGGVFRLLPQDRYTDFGTQQSNGQLYVIYDGEERTSYFSSGAAATATFKPNETWAVKWTNSFFSTIETENTNVLGRYRLSGLQEVNNFGTYQTYIDNFLKSNAFVSELKVEKRIADHTLAWGAKLIQKHFREELNELSEVGTSVSLPGNLYQNYINFNNSQLGLTSVSAFIQDSYSFSENADLQLGLRATYNSIPSKIVFSPRILFAYRPSNEHEILRFSLGVYNQDPDFRTLKNMDGYLVPLQDFQRTYNASLGYDYAFNALNTRLKFSSELYYKYASKMIPYIMDNLKIRYFANQLARGNTYGADFMLGGELVKDLVSYLRLSIMKSDQREISNPLLTLKDPVYVDVTKKRPTDQRINVSAFFQDKLMSDPSYKVHLNMVYGASMPIGQPDINKYTDYFKIPAYKRIDIGFSKDFTEDTGKIKNNAKLRKYFSSFVAFVEVFNLLNMNNTASYLWIRDVNSAQYGVPNLHTGRQLNIRLIAKINNK